MQKKGSALSGKDQLHACAVLHLSLVSLLSPMKSSKGTSTLTLEALDRVVQHKRCQGQLQLQALIQTMLEATRWRHPSSQECSPNLVSFSPSSATNSGDQHTCVCASVNLTMLSMWLGLVVNNNNNNHLCRLSQVEKPLTWVSVIYTYM